MATFRTVRRTPALLASITCVLLLAALATPAIAHDDTAHDPARPGNALGRIAPGLGAELAQVRAATARYHDVEAALADGFILPPDSHCVAGPDGAMGYHYVNFGRVGQLDPALPQVLLYVPDGDDRLRLVGVEYLSPTGGELFGQRFADGSPLGPDTALHVWLWQANPAGVFASYNPNLSCP
jgi:hypothetical protein